jgi:hypothetical protein
MQKIENVHAVACDLLNQSQNEKITTGEGERKKQFGLKLSKKKAIVI